MGVWGPCCKKEIKLKIRNATIKDKVNISRLYYELYPKKKPKKIIPINKLKFKNILFKR